MKSSITFWLATVLSITSTFAGSSVAQESGPDLATGQSMVQELLQIRDAEFFSYATKQFGNGFLQTKVRGFYRMSLPQSQIVQLQN